MKKSLTNRLNGMEYTIMRDKDTNIETKMKLLEIIGDAKKNILLTIKDGKEEENELDENIQSSIESNNDTTGDNRDVEKHKTLKSEIGKREKELGRKLTANEYRDLNIELEKK